MKSRAEWVRNFQSVVDNDRSHGIVVDLPAGKNGDDQGPTALELAVMALASCISTIFAIIAKNSNVSFSALKVDVEVDKPDSAPTITSAKAVVHIASGDDRDKLERCLEKTMKSCPVGQLYEKAGIEIGTELIVE